MNPARASTSDWDASDYARFGSFVPRLGEAALDLLDPGPGETILDIGCGDGALTERIVERGARVIGIDNSPEMVAAAQARGIDARLIDAADLPFDRDFDAAFSNAVLHWVANKSEAARGIWFALKRGGRFAGEMGGAGNLANLREVLDEQLVVRGYPPPAGSASWYPDAEEFAELYEGAGFSAIDARLIERPTIIDHGLAAWVTTFRKGMFDRSGVPQAERAEIAQAVAAHFPDNVADYVRLRFIMRKPD